MDKMGKWKLDTKFLTSVGVFILQYIVTQLVSYLVSLLLPAMETIQRESPVLFALLVGASFSAGAFLAGWLALKRNWLPAGSRLSVRLAVTLLGAYLPLAVGLLLYRSPEAGNLFYSSRSGAASWASTCRRGSRKSRPRILHNKPNNRKIAPAKPGRFHVRMIFSINPARRGNGSV